MNDAVKKPRGLAAMSPERRHEIASKGGRSVAPEKRAFSVNKELASNAGSKGGKKVRPDKRPFKMDPTLASRAGKAGAKSRAEAKVKE